MFIDYLIICAGILLGLAVWAFLFLLAVLALPVMIILQVVRILKSIKTAVVRRYRSSAR